MKDMVLLYIEGYGVRDISELMGLNYNKTHAGLINAGVKIRDRKEARACAVAKGKKIGNFKKGQKRTEEQKEKMSLAAYAKYDKIGRRGYFVNKHGYHQITTIENRCRHVHTVVVEKEICRKLKVGEVVHHIDGDKSNNDISNLKLMSNSDHAKLHSLARDHKRLKILASTRTRDPKGRFV
jgi:hypothetical protein